MFATSFFLNHLPAERTRTVSESLAFGERSRDSVLPGGIALAVPGHNQHLKVRALRFDLLREFMALETGHLYVRYQHVIIPSYFGFPLRSLVAVRRLDDAVSPIRERFRRYVAENFIIFSNKDAVFGWIHGSIFLLG